MPAMPRSTVDLAGAAAGSEKERGLAAVLLSSSPCSGGDVFIWAGMLQWEAVRGNYLLVVLYRVPENPPCRDRALWYVTTSKPHIQWKQSVVEIAQVDVVWPRWDKFALLKTSPALYFLQPPSTSSKANTKHIVHSEHRQSSQRV